MVLIVCLIAGAVAAGCAVLSSAIGFTAKGIAAGSIAASIQSYIGNVVAGSAFAWLQRAGMSGALYAIGAFAGTVSMAAGAIGIALWIMYIFVIISRLEFYSSILLIQLLYFKSARSLEANNFVGSVGEALSVLFSDILNFFAHHHDDLHRSICTLKTRSIECTP